MVTASHNENGWTGIKMGIEKGLTHSDTEMKELKNIVFKKFQTKMKIQCMHGATRPVKSEYW
jgi:phosphomannomutase/phosphoglucomutase